MAVLQELTRDEVLETRARIVASRPVPQVELLLLLDRPDPRRSERRPGSARLDYYRKGGDSLANRYRYLRRVVFGGGWFEQRQGQGRLADLPRPADEGHLPGVERPPHHRCQVSGRAHSADDRADPMSPDRACYGVLRNTPPSRPGCARGARPSRPSASRPGTSEPPRATSRRRCRG